MQHSSTILFYRFIVLLFVFVMPFAFLFVQVVMVFIWKNRMYLISKIANEIHKYNNILHTFGFIANTIIFLSAILGITVFSILWPQTWWKKENFEIWSFNNNISYTTFIAIIYIGIVLYMINCIIYYWYNLKRTDSYFAIFIWKKWQKQQLIKQDMSSKST